MTADAPPWITLHTGQGPAQVRVHHPTAGEPRGTLILGHGAGGGTGSNDLQRMLAATGHGWTVVLVEQPWRVAGRRVATPPPTLDAAWREIVPAVLVDGLLSPGPRGPLLVVGGRSAGARVACRTSPGDSDAGLGRADGVLCLAFPLHPPGRPEKSRAPELATPLAHGIPTLVVQGSADPFGAPAEVRAAAAAHSPDDSFLEVFEVPGNHSPSRDLLLVTRSVLDWLDRLG